MSSAINMAYLLIKGWNLCDGETPLELTFETFSGLPINFEDVNLIVSESGLLNMNIKGKKKTTEEIS